MGRTSLTVPPARRILRGQNVKVASPLNCPSNNRRKFELVINLKTAKQIGLTIPQKVPGGADKVIK